MESLYRKLLITGVQEEVKGFKTFTLSTEAPLDYKAGQYLTLVYNPGPEETRRSYSITSAPLLDEPLTIGVKRMDNGFFSRRLVDHARPGDELITSGAGGFFVLPEEMHQFRQFIFFAAGSGITPVYSLIKTLLHFFPGVQVRLVYSNASPEKTIFLRELKRLQEQFPAFDLVLLFSNNRDLRQARLNRDGIIGYLQLWKAMGADNLFYICGPESYNRMCTYVLQEQGIESSRVKKENFWIPRQAHTVLPPDSGDHRVVIHLLQDRFEFTVPYPDSILKAARKEGFVLPYSCEAGRCGNCVAHCLKGKVWHSYNEVLTEKELNEGLILTCTAHPVGGDVELRIS